MSIKWYRDKSAEQTYTRLKQELEPFCERNFPNYELSFAGFNQNNDTYEIQIKLHLTPRNEPQPAVQWSSGLLKC